MEDRRRRIVIVGGGFAGTTLARSLQRELPGDCDLVLVSEESHTTFHPLLPEAVGASVFPEQVVAPIRLMLRRGRFVMGRVEAIDPARRTLVARTLAGPHALDYDHLVLAFGNRARLDLVPGLVEHALPLKTVGDALHIRNMVLRRVAQIELEDDPRVRRRLGHFVVVGGGFSGVETAGELADCLRSLRRYYPRVADGELRITLLQDQPRLLTELSEALAHHAHRSLTARGVAVRTGASVACANDRAVALKGGELIETATVISTVGTRPNPLVERMLLATQRGRIVVEGDLSVPGFPGLWAVGDCAIVRNAHDGTPAPPTAQFAVREARCLAANLLAALRGEPTRAFRYRPRGALAAIGRHRGVADVFGVPVHGFAAWLLWRAYYLSQMPTLGRKLRILVEWSWGLCFPNDITHLRFERSAELDAAASPPQVTHDAEQQWEMASAA